MYDSAFFTIPAVLTAATLLLCVAQAARTMALPKRRRHNASVLCLGAAMALVWSVGYGLYMGAIMSNEDIRVLNWTEIVFRPAVASFDLFLFDIDSNVFDHLQSSPRLKGAISVTAVAAAFLTVFFVLSLFERRVREAVRTAWTTRFGNQPQVFVFLGITDRARLLATDIRRHVPPRRGLLVMVDAPIAEPEPAGSSHGFANAMRIISHKGTTFSLARSLKAIALVADRRHTAVPGSPHILADLGLRGVVRLLRNRTSFDFKFFILGNDTASNMALTSLLMADTALHACADRKDITIFCRAEDSDTNRVLENERPHPHITVRLLDEGRLSAESLKRDPGAHPANFTDVRPDGTVENDFNALVVAGDTMMAPMTGFLYEYAAFVDAAAAPDDPRRTPFRCVTGGSALPPIFNTLSGIDSATFTHTGNIDFRAEAPALNYAILATDNDADNLRMSIELLRECLAVRPDLKNLRIATRLYRPDSHSLRAVAHYNRLAAAELAADPGSPLSQDIIGRNDMPPGPIVVFGSLESIYTYENIVAEATLNDVRAYSTNYGGTPFDTEAERLLRLDTDNAPGPAPTYSAVVRLRRVFEQNASNSFHAATKRIIARKAGAEHSGRLIDVLAQTEHLRWNASHRLLGYRCPGSDTFGRDERRMTHGCIRPWRALTPALREYDYKVVRHALSTSPGS